MGNKLFRNIIIILELIALGTLLTELGLGSRILLAVALHSIAWIAAVSVAWRMLPEKHQVGKKKFFILYAVMSYFAPLIGILELFNWTKSLLDASPTSTANTIQTLSMPIFQEEVVFIPPNYGEGGAETQLTNEQINIDQRIRALLTINATSDRKKNIIIRDAMHEHIDELRLIAFGLLDKHEKSITKHINEVQVLIVKVASKTHKALLRKQLAILYWELSYQNLSEGDMSRYTLFASKQFAEKALKDLPDDPTLWLLLGKLFYHKNETSKALDAFKKAQQHDAPYSKIIPYIAEIEYKKRNWEKLQNLLSSHKALSDIPRIGPVIKFWCQQ